MRKTEILMRIAKKESKEILRMREPDRAERINFFKKNKLNEFFIMNRYTVLKEFKRLTKNG